MDWAPTVVLRKLARSATSRVGRGALLEVPASARMISPTLCAYRRCFLSNCRDASFAMADAVDRTIVVVREQQRAVLHDEHVNGPCEILVVLQEAGDERLHRLERAVGVERHQ